MRRAHRGVGTARSTGDSGELVRVGDRNVADVRRVRVTAGNVTTTAVLDDSRTARAIWEALPLRHEGYRWGDEIYFSIPVALDEENARATVSLGDLGYWAPGTALCIFFGPTPVSRGGEIRPASPVNVFGRLEGDPKVFTSVPDGSTVVVEQADE